MIFLWVGWFLQEIQCTVSTLRLKFTLSFYASVGEDLELKLSPKGCCRVQKNQILGTTVELKKRAITRN
jgi:hypothetical protein